MQRKELEIFSTSHCIHDSCTLSYQMILKIVNTLKCDVFSKKFLIFSFELTGIDCNNVAFSDYLGIFLLSFRRWFNFWHCFFFLFNSHKIFSSKKYFLYSYFDIGYYGFYCAKYSSFFELITLDALPVSSGGLLVFVIAKLVILAVPDGIRQVLLVHPMVGKVVCVLIMLAFYCATSK